MRTCTHCWVPTLLGAHVGCQAIPQKSLLSFEEGAGGSRWSAPSPRTEQGRWGTTCGALSSAGPPPPPLRILPSLSLFWRVGDVESPQRLGAGGAFTPALLNSHLCWRLAAHGWLRTWAASTAQPCGPESPGLQMRSLACPPTPVLVGGVTPVCLFMSAFAGGESWTASGRRRTQGPVSIAQCRLLLELSKLLAGRESPGARRKGRGWGLSAACECGGPAQSACGPCDRVRGLWGRRGAPAWDTSQRCGCPEASRAAGGRAGPVADVLRNCPLRGVRRAGL